jgi:type III secretion system YscQ/HrcQ family protein
VSPPAHPRGGRQHTGTEIVPSAHVSRRSVRPFSWPRLEKLTKQQARLLGRLDWIVPVSVLTGDLPETTRTRMRELLDEEVRLWLDYAHLVSPDRLRKIVVDPTFLATVNPTPQGTRGMVEFELSLAHAAMDLLLGATGTEAVALRPLTEIEEGVLSYILLEALKALIPVLEPQRPRLRLERILHGTDEAAAVFAGETEVAVVQFKISIGIHPGFFRVFLPGSLLARAVPLPDSPDRRLRHGVRLARHIGRLSAVKVALRAEIGRTEVTAREFAGLRSGDVLLVEDVTARPDKDGRGEARLRIGRGRAGHLDAMVMHDGSKYQLTIQRVSLGAEPRVQRDTEAWDGDERTTTGPPPQMEDSDVSEPAKSGAAELLNDIPMQIVVELGRVPVTVEEVVALHVGQVLELNKAVGDPVDLSVNGKIVGRGELVEVEGQIGVRVLSTSG